MCVRTLRPEHAVEGLDKGVVGRLARPREVEDHAGPTGPRIEAVRHEPCPLIDADRQRPLAMMMATTVTVLRSAHHAFDAANNAPGHTTDNASNCRANGASRAPALGRALLCASNNALRLRGEGHRKSGKNDSGFRQSDFHEQSPFCIRPSTKSFFTNVRSSPASVFNPRTLLTVP